MAENIIEKYGGRYFSLLNEYGVSVENFEAHLINESKDEQWLFSEEEIKDLISDMDIVHHTEF